ncbi:MAG TPA: protein kinase [Gemmatimonadales bacterium]|nr:protein kinase [Gemmatimonadales bacterium]
MTAPGTTRTCRQCEGQVPADAAFCPTCGLASSTPLLSETLLGASRGGDTASTSYELAPERLRRALGPHYELGRLLGRGGYAEVFTVRDLRLKRELALKVLRPDLILTDALVSRFRREAEAVGVLQNTHIVPVYDVGESDGVLWLLMPLVRGETLKSLLAREPRLPVAEARRILLEAAEALQAAHEAGVVHRDIKPENLMIEGKTQRVLLMDFGIAKAMDVSADHALTGTGVVVGTPKYMSPEQAVGKHGLDPRSDQYSLAVVGYQMLSGRVPFEGENVREVLARQLLEEAVPLSRLVQDIPGEVSSTIHQALQKDPQRRFASMNAFARALQGEEISPAEGGRVRRKSRFNIRVEKRPWIAAGLWMIALSGVAVGAYRAGYFDPAPAPPAAPVPVLAAPPPPPAGREPVHRDPAVPRGGKPAIPTGARPESTATAATPPAAPLGCEAAVQARAWDAAFASCSREAESNSAARRNLGLLYATGNGVARDDRLASVQLVFAAQDPIAPDTQAILLMARRYEAGLGVPIDRSKAAGFWEVAAVMGVKEAYPVVARHYAEGDGRRKSDSAATAWYRRAAEAGDVPSMTKLAENLARGRGVRRDEHQSAAWYSKAAELDDPEAQYQLAMLLFKGRFYQRDDAAGLLWLQRAAKQGHLEAQQELARRKP